MSSTITALTSGGGIALAGDTSGQLELKTNNGTTAVTIDASQNVGIGTASPSNKLEVNGSVRASTGDFGGSSGDLYLATLNRAGQTSSPTIDCQSATKPLVITHDSALPIIFGTSNTERMRIDSSGNVGIGTGSPAGRLHVCDSTAVNGTIRLGSSGVYYSDIQNIYANDEFRLSSYGGSQKMTFYLNGSERMRITSDGAFLLGTTTQNGATGISFSNAADSAAYGKSMYMNSPYSGTRNAISFAYNSSGVGAIVTGTSSTSYNTSSDYRLKENVAPMTDALAKVSALKPVTYTWKLDGSSGQGFIAHELQTVVPDCVSGEKDAVKTVNELDEDGNVIGTKEVPEYQGVDTSFLVATLTAAIQEQQALIENLTTRLAVLEGAK